MERRGISLQIQKYAESNNTEEVNSTFEKDSYVWVYTTLYGDQYYQITLGKGLPPNEDVDLTEEEYTWVKQREGKWTISSVSILEESKSYDEMVQEKISTNKLSGEKAYFVGGIDHIYMPVALIEEKNEIKYFIPMYEVSISGTEEQKRLIMGEGVKNIDAEIYDFQEILNSLKKMPKTDPTSTGMGAYIDLDIQSNTSYLKYLIIFILSAVGIIICVVAAKKIVSKAN